MLSMRVNPLLLMWLSCRVEKERRTGSKHALEPVVGFGMGKKAHFEAACLVSVERLDPYALEAKAAPDLRFAADKVMEHAHDSRPIRQQLQGSVEELSGRTRPLSARLRQFQPWHVRMVAGKLQLGFIAVVCLLILWGDGKMPNRFIQASRVAASSRRAACGS